MVPLCTPATKPLFLSLVLFSLVILVGVIGIKTRDQTRGKESRQAVITAYLSGLNEQNAYKIRQLTPPDYKSEDAIRKQLKIWGGSQFNGITTEFSGGTIGGFWEATIKGTRINRHGRRLSYTNQLVLREEKGRWYLLLGESDLPLPTVGPPIKIAPN